MGFVCFECTRIKQVLGSGLGFGVWGVVLGLGSAGPRAMMAWVLAGCDGFLQRFFWLGFRV